LFWQTLVTGIAIGGIYTLMAVGYSLVFGILNFSNFAHGMIIVIGAYIGFFTCTILKFSFPVVIISTVIITGIIAIFNEKIAYRPLRKRASSSLYLMISAMGVSIFIENFIYCTIGAHYLAFPEGIFGGKSLEINNIFFGWMDIWAFVISFISIILLTLFLTKNKLGIAIRAASKDITMTGALGVNVDRMLSTVFFISGVFAAIAGAFLGIRYMVYPQLGDITNKAYIAAVIGGIGSLPGAVVGGIILGIVESFVSTYLSSVYRDAFSFALLIILLIIRPTGIFGKFLEEKV
jgi:branched-chain amino acid transport system permease protein